MARSSGHRGQGCQVKSSLPGILSTGNDKLVFGQVLDRHQQLLWQDLSLSGSKPCSLHPPRDSGRADAFCLFLLILGVFVGCCLTQCWIGGRHRVSAGIILLLQERRPPGLSVNTAFLSVYQFACVHFHRWLLIQAIRIIPGVFSGSFTLGCFHPCFNQFYLFGYSLHYDPAKILALCSAVLGSTWDPLKPI